MGNNVFYKPLGERFAMETLPPVSNQVSIFWRRFAAFPHKANSLYFQMVVFVGGAVIFPQILRQFMRPVEKDETLNNALLEEGRQQWGSTTDVYGMPPLSFQSLKLGIIDNFLINSINDLMDNESLFSEQLNYMFTGEANETGLNKKFDPHTEY